MSMMQRVDHRTVCVFLPSVKFIVYSERDTLLKATLGIRGPSNNVPFELKRKLVSS